MKFSGQIKTRPASQAAVDNVNPPAEYGFINSQNKRY